MKTHLVTLVILVAVTASFWGLTIRDTPQVIVLIDDSNDTVQESMGRLVEDLEDLFGFKATVTAASDRVLIDQGDLVIISSGLKDPAVSEDTTLSEYIEKGRPAVGINFGSPDGDLGSTWMPFSFGGMDWEYSGRGFETFALPSAEFHPILRGIPRHQKYESSPLHAAVAISDTATPLILARSGPASPARNVAWVNERIRGSRQFFISLGSSTEIDDPVNRRLIMNAIFWALGKQIPRGSVTRDGTDRMERSVDDELGPPQRQRPWDAIVLSENVEDHWSQAGSGKVGPTNLIVTQPGRGDIVTFDDYDDYRLKLDFRITSSPPDTTSIWKGNSGVILQRGYEIQIVEPQKVPTVNDCGAITGFKAPDQFACLGAGRWQHLEARVIAPRFQKGVRISNGRLTVFLNGSRIHDKVELVGDSLTGNPDGVREGPLKNPIRLQSDSGLVQFANVWIEPFDEQDRRIFLSNEPALTGNRWEDMDYGPFLTASIEAPYPAGNIAYKGIAIPLYKAWDARRGESIVFDTDLLRYAFAWEGGFLNLRGVVFDRTHNTHPSIEGKQVFSNPIGPGWSKDGNFDDPRSMKWEPLPREIGRYEGLSLYKNRVIFRYRVGDSQVLDMPGLETSEDGQRAFTRDLEIKGNREGMTVQIASGRGPSSRFLTLKGLEPTSLSLEANETIAVIAEGQEVIATGAIGAPEGARWRIENSDIQLYLPPAEGSTRLRIFVWNGLNEEIRVLPKLIQENTSLESLARLTEGGPARWPDRIVTKGEIGSSQGPFAVDRISWPEPNPWKSWIRFGGFDFFKDSSRAALSTWSGDVWLLSGIDEGLEELDWQRIATGLYQPLGLKIVDEDIYVLARDQITILRDLNEDGEADYYENFSNDLQNTEHFHEFAMDLQTDSRGDFYFMKGGRHGKDSLIPQHGTLLKVAKDGSTLDIIANGFRAPNGLLIRPDGRFVSTDQQGHWIPANRINILEPGGFYGYMWSFHQKVRPTEYSDPLLWIHPAIDRSPSTLVWTTSPSWPQMKERMLSLSYGMGKIDLVMTEEVDGKMQGALTRLPLDFETGIMRGQFHPADGHLYAAGMFGWAGNKISPGGFYRIRRTREPLHLPVSFQTVKDGIFITFTNELDPRSATDSGNFHVQEWNYEWKERYGSPDFKLNGEEGRDEVIVEWSALSPDRKTVFLKLENLRPAMQMHTEFSLRAGDGTSVRNFLHGSIFNLGSRSSEEIVTPRWHREVTADKPDLKQLGPGLMQEIRPLPQKQGPETRRLRTVHLEADYRTTRMAALHVPQGADPSPFVSAGGFSSNWRGYLRSPLNTKVQFSFEGNGAVRMFVNGKVVVSKAQGLIDGLKSNPLDLIGGLNGIEIFYQSPRSGDATFRLFWSSGEWLTEPVPPHLFLHEKNDPRLLQGDLNRKGRDLFAHHKCLNCHRPKNPRIKFSEESMPELVMMAPRLDGIGAKRRSDWLANWIENPSQVRSDAQMPALLKGLDSTQQAADIASFLVGMSKPSPNHNPQWLHRPEVIGRGETLVKTLGCLACHSIGDGEAPGKDALDGVANEWHPNGLADYLEKPQEHEEWSEMPDFRLSYSESKAITAYLFSFGQNIGEAPRGDPQRGGELVKALGCANCHRLSGFKSKAVEPSFEKIRRRTWSTGCLAENPDLRGNAPDLNLRPSERSAVVSFVQNSTDSLRRRNWAEFATRQSRKLRCWSCHGIDNKGPTWFPQVPESISQEIATIHNKIPDLSWAGEKLQQPWMEKLIRGSLPYKTRPRLTARMPSFPAFSKGLSIGMLQQHGISKLTSEEKTHDTSLARLGKGLIGAQQLGCVQCHLVGGSAALAGPDTETIDLRYVGDRLRQKFFQRILRDPSRVIPGTMMPSFMDSKGRSTLQPILGGDGDEQGRAIWEYIQSLN